MTNTASIGFVAGRGVRLGLLLGLLEGVAACGSSGAYSSPCPGDDASVRRPENWTNETHCPGTPADYDEVFDATRVRRLDITFSQSDFDAGVADLREILLNKPSDLDAMLNPMWTPATVSYNGVTWSNVGVRWKGHASLNGAWNTGIRKLSMKVKFDAFEDSDPQTEDQRFFGFSGFALGNGYQDASQIRDKTGGDIFRAAGVPMSRSSFAAVYVDVGRGPYYFGLYTIIEEPEDRMLETQIGSGDGNLYKPWNDAARWKSLSEIGTVDVQTYFEKATNELTSDWSDVIAAINALHADRTNAAAWRAGLEQVFDVQSFLKVQAVNQTILNWDSYGCMHHNYLVYANPMNSRRLTWLPWDLNESQAAVQTVECAPVDSVMRDEIVAGTDTTIDTDWPLIKFILGDATYRSDYKGHVRAVLNGAYAADRIKAQMQADHDLIAPYIVGPIATENAGGSSDTNSPFGGGKYFTASAEAFTLSLTTVIEKTNPYPLFPHVVDRHTKVEAALAAAP